MRQCIQFTIDNSCKSFVNAEHCAMRKKGLITIPNVQHEHSIIRVDSAFFKSCYVKLDMTFVSAM